MMEPIPDSPVFIEEYEGLTTLRALPLRKVRVGSVRSLTKDSQAVTITGHAGELQLDLEVLCSRSSGGSWYLSEPVDPPRRWIGRCFAGNS